MGFNNKGDYSSIANRSTSKQFVLSVLFSYEGECPELKFDCDCLKPKPGMMLNAARDFNIDLLQSWMIGDGENDIKTGQNAGCQTALIGSGSYGQTVTVSSLKDFVESYLRN